MNNHHLGLFNSLRNRFAVPTILFTVILLLGSNFYRSYNVVKQQYADLNFKATTISELAALALQDPLWNYNTLGINTACKAITQDLAVASVRVLNEHRIEIAVNHKPEAMYASSFCIYSEKKISRGTETIGYVVVGITKYYVEKSIRKEIANTFIEIIFVSLLLLVVIILISQAVTKPLRLLNASAGEIASGNLSARIPIHSHDEIGQLAEGFNAMAQQLTEMFNNIHETGEMIATAAKEFLLSSETTQNLIQEITGNSSLPEADPADFARSIDEFSGESINLHLLTKKFLEIIAVFKIRTVQLAETNEELRSTLEMIQLTQAQIIETEKMAGLGSLVAGVAHEINTPLGVSISISSYLEKINTDFIRKLSEDSVSKRDFGKFLDNINESVSILTVNLNRAAELIKNFKKMAVDQSNDIKTRFSIKDDIDAVIISLKHESKKTGLIINNNCPEQLEINSFPGAISQILTNLIINSIKHGFKNREAGVINIDCQPADHLLHLVYSDNGRGIAPDIIDKIFQPFFTTDRQGGNSGLGMNIVYNLVTQKLKGSIRCESTVGQGVKFFIDLPEI